MGENNTCVFNLCIDCEHNEICFKHLECLSRASAVLCDGEYIREEDECPGSCGEEHGYFPRSNNRCMWRDEAVLCGGEYIHLTSPRCPDMCKPEECAASKYFKLL